MRLFFIRSFEDNYIWILENKKTCVIVDPGQSEKVCHFLHKRKFLPIAQSLSHIIMMIMFLEYHR
ncbi:hypothetical protein [Candidatus Riesia pediculischaeffi]|uniref:Hydroxyacylglutathione hydrolase n=1 Tax=Candidatus Riesia pediculischaeffi TaxID=428411 RepID=A0A1V0HKK0_9ENTR|nr:hypothetical protein [Candidatus Riesia pediculischaeffi]ARC53367.1 hypothetical protein AOQ87_01705 [Candidatus Riesia pediculischaeffi]